jgi:membrane-associated phospholipid phosphatase
MDLQKRRPSSLAPRALTAAGWTAFVIAGCIFLAIAWNVSSRAPLVALDARVAGWLHAHATPGVTTVMLAVTHANSTLAISIWAMVLGLVLARMREWYWMASVALAVGGGLTLNVLLKYAYERARPRFDDPLLELGTYSFPSGHTAGAVVFYGVLAAFLSSRVYSPASAPRSSHRRSASSCWWPSPACTSVSIT